MDWLNAIRNLNDENNISMIQITKIIANSITLRNTLQKLHNTIIEHIIAKDEYIIIRARKDFYDKYSIDSMPIPKESCINHLIRVIKKVPPPFLNEYRSIESDPARILGDLILDIRMIYGYSYRPYRESIKDSKISKTSSSSAVDFSSGGNCIGIGIGNGITSGNNNNNNNNGVNNNNNNINGSRKESDVNIPISARMSTARSQMYTSKVAPINKDINRDSSNNASKNVYHNNNNNNINNNNGSNSNNTNKGSVESTIIKRDVSVGNRISLHPGSEILKDSLRRQPL